MDSNSISIFSVSANAFVTFFMLTFQTASIRLHQLQSILKRKSKQKFLYFRKFYIKSLVHQSKSNKVFGEVFLVSLLVNLPSNCITCLQIVFSINSMYSIVLYILAISQFFLLVSIILLLLDQTLCRKICANKS